MNRASNTGFVGGGMLLGAVAAAQVVTSGAFAADVLTLGDVRVVYEHTEFDNAPPAMTSPRPRTWCCRIRLQLLIQKVKSEGLPVNF